MNPIEKDIDKALNPDLCVTLGSISLVLNPTGIVIIDWLAFVIPLNS
jgi:hypothetical protein